MHFFYFPYKINIDCNVAKYFVDRFSTRYAQDVGLLSATACINPLTLNTAHVSAAKAAEGSSGLSGESGEWSDLVSWYPCSPADVH